MPERAGLSDEEVCVRSQVLLMSKQSIEMRKYLDRAEGGDPAAMARIRVYVEEQVFPMFDEERLPQEERAEILSSDRRCLITFSLIVDQIEEAGPAEDTLPDIRAIE